MHKYLGTTGGVPELSNQDVVLQWLLLALPAAVLVTLVVLLQRKIATARKRTAEAARSDWPAASGAPQSLFGMPVSDPLLALTARIDAATRTDDKATLAPLYLELAGLHRADAREADMLKALRSAAGLGAQHGPRSAHAAARLALAEAAFDAGDLTSACEQWQLARTALQEDGQKDAHARVEKRMRDHGCPTDWVLTDF